MISARTAAGRKSALRIKVRNNAGTLKNVARVSVRNASGVLKVAWSALAALVNNPTPSGFGDSTGAITITTNSVTASPSGGSGPFSYAWTHTGGDVGTPLSPSSATTAFSFSGIGPGDSKTGTFTCTITDGSGATAPVSVTATATNVNTA